MSGCWRIRMRFQEGEFLCKKRNAMYTVLFTCDVRKIGIEGDRTWMRSVPGAVATGFVRVLIKRTTLFFAWLKFATESKLRHHAKRFLLRVPHAAQESHLHYHRRRDHRSCDRREPCELQCHEWRAAAETSLQGPGAAGAGPGRSTETERQRLSGFQRRLPRLA